MQSKTSQICVGDIETVEVPVNKFCFFVDGVTQEEAELAEEEPLDPLLSANVRSMVKAAPGQTSYVSQLKDPELQELASTAAQHISTTVR